MSRTFLFLPPWCQVRVFIHRGRVVLPQLPIMSDNSTGSIPTTPPYVDEDYVVVKSSIKNIVILGKTGVGKSTFHKMLLDPEAEVASKTFSQTRSAEVHSMHFRGNSSNNNTTLQIIDTPGLFENREKQSERRDNIELLKLIYDCVDHNLTHINIVAIAVRMDTGFNTQEVDACNELIEFLGPEFSKSALLLITHAEMGTPARRQRYIEEMSAGETTRDIIRYCSLGHLFVGCLDAETVESYPGIRESLLDRVRELRRNALAVLMRSEAVPIPGEYLKFAEKRKEEERRVVVEQRRIELEVIAENYRLEAEALTKASREQGWQEGRALGAEEAERRMARARAKVMEEENKKRAAAEAQVQARQTACPPICSIQ
eukprot:TRINITY_DN5009_c0_g1_i2.p1 TRINITY_DN5009_c0_g1~~TRINITY_DN5009_c0_g1_i2.p1  ORF type:complete len:373 (+),score=34.20 TRINITY_DN5009_c0_g1_i2:293-1411(+)